MYIESIHCTETLHQKLNMVKCQDNLTIWRMNCALEKTKFKELIVSVPCSFSFRCVSSMTLAGFGWSIRIISSVIKRHASLQFHWAAASLCPSVIFHFFIKHFPDMPEKCLLFRKEAWNNFSLAYYIASRRSTPPQWQKVNYFIQIAARNHYIGADWFDKYWPYEKKQYITRQRFIMKRDRWN